jgi:hypothetical protein
MKNAALVLLLLLFIGAATVPAVAQKEIDEETPWTFRERAYTGIGFGGLSFGRHSIYGNHFSIGAGVLGGFMLTKNLSTGVGFEYQYTTYSEAKIKNHVYGGYPFVRYNIKNFFIQFDYDMYILRTDFRTATQESREERFFGGVGFFNPGRGRTMVNFLISYDFLYDSSSLFGSPLNTRLFFTF